MSAPWDFSDAPGDPVADFKRVFRMLDEVPKPTADRFKIASKEALLEHVETRGNASPLDRMAGLPLVIDENVEPGWIEAWLDGECVNRIRIA